MGEPLLCRLGFHKWQNYGNQVMVSWKEPVIIGGSGGITAYGSPPPIGPDGLPRHIEVQDAHGEVVYEGKQCKRCGMKLMRRFVTNSDGTISCVGWEPGTDDTQE